MFTIIPFLTSFLSDNKLKIIIGLSFVILIFLTYFKGVSDGVKKEKSRLSVEYSQVLEEKLKENTDRLTKEFSEKLIIEKNKIEKEKAYNEKQSKAISIVIKSKKLNSEEDLLSDEELKEFNKLTRKVK